MQYNSAQRVFMLKKYIKYNNVTLVQRAWRSAFKVKTAPYRRSILRHVTKVEKTGSVNLVPLKKPKTSNKRLNAKNLLKRLIEENPALSIRKLSSAAKISFGMTQDILRRDLKLKPYKYQEGQELKHADYEKRVTFAE